jgi:hypothetical protein
MSVVLVIFDALVDLLLELCGLEFLIRHAANVAKPSADGDSRLATIASR